MLQPNMRQISKYLGFKGFKYRAMPAVKIGSRSGSTRVHMLFPCLNSLLVLFKRSNGVFDFTFDSSTTRLVCRAPLWPTRQGRRLEISKHLDLHGSCVSLENFWSKLLEFPTFQTPRDCSVREQGAECGDVAARGIFLKIGFQRPTYGLMSIR